uniref:Uncharacterized protein n=1 Tax=Alexandrium monilatum TaxID=311494 RepID=A0A7S4Q5U3_9DINO
MAAGAVARPAALQLAAAALARHGLSFGVDGKRPLFGRLKPLLELVAAELRLGLEGHAPRENLCAACMALESAIIAFGHESEDLEEGGELLDVQDCLRQIHRAIADVHSYCADLPAGDGPPPAELALVARVAAAWQLEDARQFSAEFQRSLPALCRLAPAEFQVLLPCIQETHDWHLTPAFGAVLHSTLSALVQQAAVGSSQASDGRGAGEASWRQGALMLTEVALDAAAYLPEAALDEGARLPEVLPQTVHASAPSAASLGLAASAAPRTTQMPRPLQAADPEHPGVLRLCDWSCALWAAGAGCTAGPQRWELGTLCGALLVSVPEAAVFGRGGVASAAAGTWAAVVECLFHKGSAVEATTWRLAMRLAGFALDRHRSLAEALARGAAAGPSAKLRPPEGALPGADDEEDEWAPADQAATRAVEEYLAAARPAAAAATAAAAVAPPSAVQQAAPGDAGCRAAASSIAEQSAPGASVSGGPGGGAAAGDVLDALD